MKTMRATRTVKYKGKYYNPGDLIEISEKKIVEYLIREKSAEITEVNRSLSPIELLMEVSGVNKKTAELLMSKGIETVEQLSGESLEDLKNHGLSEKQAALIYNAFE